MKMIRVAIGEGKSISLPSDRISDVEAAGDAQARVTMDGVIYHVPMSAEQVSRMMGAAGNTQRDRAVSGRSFLRRMDQGS